MCLSASGASGRARRTEEIENEIVMRLLTQGAEAVMWVLPEKHVSRLEQKRVLAELLQT